MNPAAHWMTLVRRSAGAPLCGGMADRMRERHLTFGGRLLCPFLRPFFFSSADEQRVARAAALLYTLGEPAAERRAGGPPHERHPVCGCVHGQWLKRIRD